MAKIKPGTICHIEIPAPKFQKTRNFYSRLFGWDTSRVMTKGYGFFSDGVIGGGLDATAKPSPKAGPVLVIEAADIDKKLAQIKKAGGKVVKPKTAIGDGHGHYAYFLDPNGNIMGLHSS